MNEEDALDAGPSVSVDSEIKELLGLFDVPAFARRGQDLEHALRRVHARCATERKRLLEMVKLRLRQWSRVATGPDDGRDVFTAPIDSLWRLADLDPPEWAEIGVSIRRQRAVARDLVASVQRFNARWTDFLWKLNLEPTNQTIDQYNTYYVLEKECVMGSARLAARHFTAVSRFSPELLLKDYPLLPVPVLLGP